MIDKTTSEDNVPIISIGEKPMTMTETHQMQDSSETYEQLVLAIMRRLPSYRVLELLDFARFLEAQTAKRTSADMSKSETEDAWERVFAKPAAKRLLYEMANEAREEYGAGRTTAIIITDNGELAPA